MALYSNAAIVRAVLMMRLHNQLVENVFHFRTKNADIPDSEIATTIRNEVWRHMDDNLSAELTCESITVQEIFPVARDPYELAVGEVGAQEGDSLPTANAVVVALKTGLGGRTNRGRKYVAGYRADDTENSRLIDTSLAATQADWDTINTFFQVGNSLSNLTWGILHRRHAGAPVPLSADSYVPITSVVVRAPLGTMRSRLPGHGS
jgi:hypothetical protein